MSDGLASGSEDDKRLRRARETEDGRKRRVTNFPNLF